MLTRHHYMLSVLNRYVETGNYAFTESDCLQIDALLAGLVLPGDHDRELFMKLEHRFQDELDRNSMRQWILEKLESEFGFLEEAYEPDDHHDDELNGN